ncbi:Alpha/Beta hydrolase protein [Mycena amicta]|nr:Alpha/Beta hydrolase protein [Mycena amicta]
MADLKGITSGNLSTFLGIRYAAPAPRFTLPKPPIPFAGVQDAKEPSAACPQQAISPNGPGVNFTGSYTSMSGRFQLLRSRKLPVFFLLVDLWRNTPRGGFEVGFYEDNNVRPLVERSIFNGEPVVVVTPNYRVSAYGFLGGEEAKLSAEIFALEWVQTHISAFGGDPERVVIGLRLPRQRWAKRWLYLRRNSPPQKRTNSWLRTFSAARLCCAQSSGSPIPSPSLAAGQPDYDFLVTANNCTSAKSTLGLSQNCPSERVQRHRQSHCRPVVLPGVELDGDVIVRSPLESVQMGKFARVLAVSRRDEEGHTKGRWHRYQFINGDVDDEGTQIAKVAELYPEDPSLGSPFNTGTANALTPQFKRISAFQGDYIFQAGRRPFLKQASNRQPTWSYLSKRFKATPYFGAFHGSDIGMWLPTAETTDFVAADFLIHFINTLDPNHGKGLFWPTWNTHSVSGTNSLFTFSDPDVVNITAEDFRVGEINYLHGILLDGAAA